MAVQVTQPGASGAIWWPNLQLMQVPLSGGQICNKCKWFHVVAKFNPSHGVCCLSGNVSVYISFIYKICNMPRDDTETCAFEEQLDFWEFCRKGCKGRSFLPNGLLRCAPLCHCPCLPFHTLCKCQLFGAHMQVCFHLFPSWTSLKII